MDPRVVQQLEERLVGLQDISQVELYNFSDDDLALYPAIEIQGTNLTIEQYELVACNLINLVRQNNDESLNAAARGMASLAYNTLMDLPRGSKQVTTFFQRYNKTVYTENWLRINGLSTLELSSLACEIQGLNLRLINPSANLEFERKASIGVWAFSHFKAPSEICGLIRHDDFDEHSFRQRASAMFDAYGFNNCYEFPQYNKASLIEKFRNLEMGEIRYLFYRTAIILEQLFHEQAFRKQKQLLIRTAFGGLRGLRYSGQGLWQYLFRAANKLRTNEYRINVERLLEYLDQILQDPRWSRYSARSREVVRVLREYNEVNENGRNSRYYMYARLINERYFRWLDWSCNRELSLALCRIINRNANLNTESPYKEWGELLATTILENLHQWHTNINEAAA